MHQMLNANLMLNQISNTHSFLQGAGEKQDRLFVPLVDYGNDGNFGAISLQPDTGTEAVMVAPIDDLKLSRCNLIKVDAEGMEKPVLTGARETIAQHRPFLHVENDREDRSEKLIAFLLDLDYDVYWHLNYLFNPDNFFGNHENVFGRLVAINLLCVPQERKVVTTGMFRAKSANSRWQEHVGPADELAPASVVIKT